MGDNMTALQITTLTNTIANILAEALPPEHLNIATAVFSQIGDTLATISAVNELTDTKTEYNFPTGPKNE